MDVVGQDAKENALDFPRHVYSDVANPCLCFRVIGERLAEMNLSEDSIPCRAGHPFDRDETLTPICLVCQGDAKNPVLYRGRIMCLKCQQKLKRKG